MIGVDGVPSGLATWKMMELAAQHAGRDELHRGGVGRVMPTGDERAAAVGRRRAVGLVSLTVIEDHAQQRLREGRVVRAVVDVASTVLHVEGGHQRVLGAVERFAAFGERHLVEQGMLGVIEHEVDADHRCTVRGGEPESADDLELWCARLAGVPALLRHPGFEIVGNAGHGHLQRLGALSAEDRTLLTLRSAQRIGHPLTCGGFEVPPVRVNPALGADTRLISPYCSR
jgi:hypothetical protein